jgi:prophage regulatory protein
VEVGRFFLQRSLLFERNCARIIDWEKNIMNAFTGQTFQMHKLISIKQVVEYTGLNRSTVYEIMNEKSPYYDPTFPKKIKMTQNRICWSVREINQWIESKMVQR